MRQIFYVLDLTAGRLVSSAVRESTANRRADTLTRRTGHTHAVAQLLTAYQSA